MVDTHLEAEESENESPTQRKQRSTRMLYDADDAVVAHFFANNTPRSQALHDLIYLFAIEHGSDANVSQLLRERFATLAGLNRNTDSNGATSAAEPAPKVKPKAKKPARTQPKASTKAEPVAVDSAPAQVSEDPEVSEIPETVETEVVAPPQEKNKPEAPKPQSAAHNSAADDDDTDGPSEAQRRLAADFQAKFASRNRKK